METGGRRLACDPGRDPGRDPAPRREETTASRAEFSCAFLDARAFSFSFRSMFSKSSARDSASSSEVSAGSYVCSAASEREPASCSRRALPPRDVDDEPDRWCARVDVSFTNPCPPRRRPARPTPSPPSPPSGGSRRCRRGLGDACASERCRRRCSSRRSESPSAAGGCPSPGTSPETALARLAYVEEYTLAPASAAPSRLPARNTPARASVPPLSPEPLMSAPGARR